MNSIIYSSLIVKKEKVIQKLAPANMSLTFVPFVFYKLGNSVYSVLQEIYLYQEWGAMSVFYICRFCEKYIFLVRTLVEWDLEASFSCDSVVC